MRASVIFAIFASAVLSSAAVIPAAPTHFPQILPRANVTTSDNGSGNNVASGDSAKTGSTNGNSVGSDSSTGNGNSVGNGNSLINGTTTAAKDVGNGSGSGDGNSNGHNGAGNNISIAPINFK